MKFRSHAFFSPLSQFSVIACASLYAVADVNAASAAWLAAPATGNWVEDANWNPASAPGATTGTTNTDTATFGTSSLRTVAADANRNLLNITFSANNTYTLSGGPILLTTGGKILANGSSASQNISAPLQIQGDPGTYTLQSDVPGGNRLVTLTGAISGVATAPVTEPVSPPNTTILNLDGASGTNNIINAVISDGVAGGKLAIVKSGTGSWSLATGNTFTGGITVNSGTLRTGNSGDTNLILGTGTVTMNGGTVLLGSTSATNFNNPLVVNAATTNRMTFRGNHSFNPLTMTGTGTLIIGHSSPGPAVNTVTTTNLRDFGGTIQVVQNGTIGNILRLGSGFIENSMQNAVLDMQANTTLSHQSGTSGTFTTSIGTLTGAAGSYVGAGAAGGGTIVFSVGNRNEDSFFAGVIGNGGTKSALTKVGTAKLTLTNYNTYTGPTRVSGGILSITNAYLPNTAAVTVDTGAVLDLNFDDTDFVGSLSLGGSGPLPDGIYNSLDETYGAYFTGTGSLRVGVTGFSTWSAANVSSQSPSLDFDKDGVSNGIEYFFGETTPVFTTNPGIVTTGSVRSVTWPMSGSYTGTYKVETSPNLVTWTDVTGAAVVDSGTLTYTLPSSEPKLFVRLTVVPE